MPDPVVPVCIKAVGDVPIEDADDDFREPRIARSSMKCYSIIGKQENMFSDQLEDCIVTLQDYQ